MCLPMFGPISVFIFVLNSGLNSCYIVNEQKQDEKSSTGEIAGNRFPYNLVSYLPSMPSPLSFGNANFAYPIQQQQQYQVNPAMMDKQLSTSVPARDKVINSANNGEASNYLPTGPYPPLSSFIPYGGYVYPTPSGPNSVFQTVMSPMPNPYSGTPQYGDFYNAKPNQYFPQQQNYLPATLSQTANSVLSMANSILPTSSPAPVSLPSAPATSAIAMNNGGQTPPSSGNPVKVQTSLPPINTEASKQNINAGTSPVKDVFDTLKLTTPPDFQQLAKEPKSVVPETSSLSSYSYSYANDGSSPPKETLVQIQKSPESDKPEVKVYSNNPLPDMKPILLSSNNPESDKSNVQNTPLPAIKSASPSGDQINIVGTPPTLVDPSIKIPYTEKPLNPVPPTFQMTELAPEPSTKLLPVSTNAPNVGMVPLSVTDKVLSPTVAAGYSVLPTIDTSDTKMIQRVLSSVTNKVQTPLQITQTILSGIIDSLPNTSEYNQLKLNLSIAIGALKGLEEMLKIANNVTLR